MIKAVSRLLGQIALVLAALSVVGCANEGLVSPNSGAFSFGLIGDQQYNAAEEKQFAAMLLAINSEPLAFVVHVGDFKAGGSSPCTDALLASRYTEFDQSEHPLIYTPGDNDWVDCHRPTNGNMDPLDRLNKLRELFFHEARSLGKTKLPLSSPASVFANDPVLSRYRENTMWVHRGLVFATFNIQGSNDNVGIDPASDAEQRERVGANIKWLKTAFARAKQSDILGLVVISHANPGFEESPAAVAKSVYAPFLIAFEQEAEALGKPVMFAHGDSHRHRVDQPYKSPMDKRAIQNVMRVEGYGSPHVNWVRVTVEPEAKAIFIVSSGNFLLRD